LSANQGNIYLDLKFRRIKTMLIIEYDKKGIKQGERTAMY
jgi:hypothetical protein